MWRRTRKLDEGHYRFWHCLGAPSLYLSGLYHFCKVCEPQFDFRRRGTYNSNLYHLALSTRCSHTCWAPRVGSGADVLGWVPTLSLRGSLLKGKSRGELATFDPRVRRIADFYSHEEPFHRVRDGHITLTRPSSRRHLQPPCEHRPPFLPSSHRSARQLAAVLLVAACNAGWSPGMRSLRYSWLSWQRF